MVVLKENNLGKGMLCHLISTGGKKKEVLYNSFLSFLASKSSYVSTSTIPPHPHPPKKPQTPKES